MRAISLIIYVNLVMNIAAMDLNEIRMKFIYGEHLKPSELDALKKSQNGNLAPLLTLKRDNILKLSPAEEAEVNRWEAIIAKKYEGMLAKPPLQ